MKHTYVLLIGVLCFVQFYTFGMERKYYLYIEQVERKQGKKFELDITYTIRSVEQNNEKVIEKAVCTLRKKSSAGNTIERLFSDNSRAKDMLNELLIPQDIEIKSILLGSVPKNDD